MSDAERSRLLALQSAPLNSWIALSDDETRIVAVGASYEEAARDYYAVNNAGSTPPPSPYFR